MAETTTGNQLEQDVAQIEQDLASKREALRRQKEAGAIEKMPSEKEVLHSVVREKIHQQTPTQPTPQQNTVQPKTHIPPQVFHKVQALVNTAFTKSLDDAVKEALATNNAALIDAFHDLLVDDLYNHLVERGKLKAM